MGTLGIMALNLPPPYCRLSVTVGDLGNFSLVGSLEPGFKASRTRTPLIERVRPVTVWGPSILISICNATLMCTDRARFLFYIRAHYSPLQLPQLLFVSPISPLHRRFLSMSDNVYRTGRNHSRRGSITPYGSPETGRSPLPKTGGEQQEGCFPCRFRKKKCQKVEGQVRCLDCTKFNIYCEGQGQDRPSVRPVSTTRVISFFRRCIDLINSIHCLGR